MSIRAMVVSSLYGDPEARGKLRALAGLGCAVGVVTPTVWHSRTDGTTRTAAFEHDGGVHIYPVPLATRRRADAGHWDRSAVRRALKEFRPDLVQLEERPWTTVAGIAAWFARRERAPLVVFGEDRPAMGLPLLARLRRERVLRQARGCVGGSRSALEALRSDSRNIPVAIIPQTGVRPPLAPTAAEPSEHLHIGFVGRLLHERGVDLLFHACVRLHGSWSVHVVGTGPVQEQLELLAARLGIASRVTWHGAVNPAALDQLWPRFDCVVLPSRTTPRWTELRGHTALEAMARGIPVIASETGVLPELLGGGGLLVPEGHIDRLAEALESIRADRELRTRLGVAARQRVLAEYTDEAIARRTLDLWQAVLASATG